MGHVVEAATVPPVSPNMQGMSLYRSPSKIMPSLPSHTPTKQVSLIEQRMHHRDVQVWPLEYQMPLYLKLLLSRRLSSLCCVRGSVR